MKTAMMMAMVVGVSGLTVSVAQAGGCCGGGTPEVAPAVQSAEQANKDTAAVKVQTTCPVMGGKINKKQFADVKGKRIYVCCPGCIGKIKADPDKYIKQIEKDGVTLDTPPKKQAKSNDAHKGHNH